MKFANHLLIVSFAVGVCVVTSSQDVTIKDPYLIEIAEFAKANLLKQKELGLENRTLNKIIDAQVIPFPPPIPAKYVLTLEFSDWCHSNNTCSNGSYICEVTIVGEPATKMHTVEEGSSKCARKELDGPLKFTKKGSSIASLLKTDDSQTLLMAKLAVAQMAEKKDGKHTLKHIGKSRRVMIEETNTNYYYLTLYISTIEEGTTDEVCEVTMEEVLSEPSVTSLQSLRCFSTGDESSEFGIVPVSPEDLSSSFMRDAILASLAVIDSESLSEFQLRVIGYSLEDSGVSVDSGTRDLQFRLGLVPTFCLKTSDEEEEEAKFCSYDSIDASRDPSVCSITLTQWPWVTDGYLFSDFHCNQSSYETIGEELETIVDEDFHLSEDDESEVEEVGSNDVQQRSDDGEEEEEDEEETEEEEEVEEETSVAEKAPCVGCPTDVNPNNNEDILEKANFALSALESAANSKKVMRIVRILKASTQVVSGILYKMTVELAETNCLLDAEKLERSKCQMVANGERRTCSVTVWHQPWVGAPKIQDPLCAEIGAKKESRSVKTPLLGGPRDNKTLSPDDEDVKMMANFALSRLNNFDDNSKKRLLVKIYQPRSHIVARSKTYQMNLEVAFVDCTEESSSKCPIPESGSHYCAVQVLAQASTDSYVPKRLVQSNCYPNQDKAAVAETETETEKVVGDVRSADNDPDYIQSVAQFATSGINDKINDNSRVKLVRVVRAQTQLVAGKRVTLDLEVGFTNCSRGNSAGICELDSSRDSMVCHVTVWDRPWLNDRRLTNITCDSLSLLAGKKDAIEENKSTNLLSTYQPVKPLTGVEKPIDSVSEVIEVYADFALAVVEDQSNTDKKLHIVKILASSIQEFQEGKNIRLTLEIAVTDCDKNEQSQPCSINKAGNYQICNIVLWDQTALHQKQVASLDCQPKNQKTKQIRPRTRKSEDIDESPFVGPVPKTYILGGPIEVDTFKKWRKNGGFTAVEPTNGAVVEMANFAAAAISQSTNNEALSLLTVVSAAKRIAAGVKYQMTVLLKGVDDQQFSCKVLVFDQILTNQRQLTSFECDDPSDQPKTAKPAPSDPLDGGFSAINTDDEVVQEIVSFAVAEISQSSNSGPFTLVKITSVSTQVVGGTIYKIGLRLIGSDGLNQNCEVEVFDQFWTSTREMNSFSCVPGTVPPQMKLKSTRSVNIRNKRGIVGGVTPMDINEDKVKELAKLAVSTFSERSNESDAPKVFRMLSASKQVVAGIKYKLNFEIGFTECTEDSKTCTGLQRCVVSIVEQPWLNKQDVSQFSCKNVKKSSHPSRALHGRGKAVDPSSEEMQRHAALALRSIQAQSNSANLLSIVRIKNAATQTVSGKKIYLTLEIAETKCLHNGTDTSENDCTIDDKAGHQLCKIEIWSRPWLNQREVTDVKCAPIGSSKSSLRTKRETNPGYATRHRKKINRLQHMTAFRSYSREFKKIYSTWKEFEYRYKVYRDNQKRIELLNHNEQGTAVFGDTPYSDWTEEEFKERLNGMKPTLRNEKARLPQAIIPTIELPKEFDWRHHNVVTPVKNQGSCGSCWAFSVTGNVEGVYGAKYGQLVSLSEQELVDCDKLDNGCNGGLPENAYKAIQDLGGLELETDYPYNGEENQCNFNSNITRVQVAGGVEISTNETKMAQWLVKNGPISIGINANGMQFYRGGISHPWKVLCRAGGIDHGVLIVGYGVAEYPRFKKTLPYWIVKNSWGTKWGEQGYYRVYRGDGTCGVNQMATSAIIN